jgi:hypothetical protein
MQKLITRIALCRRGVKIFEKEVNDLMASGWDLDEYDVEPGFFRIICSAILTKDDCDCSCCKDACSCDCSCCKKHKE